MGDATNKANGDHPPHQFERVSSQPENPFSKLITDQTIVKVPSFTLESGETLHNVPVAYSTRGKLAPTGDNVMVICHALSGSADVGDWWGPLMGGSGAAFDISRFFVICLNTMGSPYGTASPVTYKNGDPDQGRYGPEFPLTTIRDDVNLHRLVLDNLGVKQIAVAVGGSMGGMQVLEYAFLGKDYVRSIIPIATSSQHSAWGISWGEAQRQSIYSDPKYDDGYYSFEDPPAAGLGAARMSALLTYRSRNSFESRFGRNIPDPSRQQNINGTRTISNEHWAIHNEGHKGAGSPRSSASNGSQSVTPSHTNGYTTPTGTETMNGMSTFVDPQFHGAKPIQAPDPPPTTLSDRKRATTYFSAQSYLRYQGQKFVKRFDSNCYLAITRKLDTHDITRYRVDPYSTTPVADALAMIEQPALVIGIESDGLFTFAEQQEIAAGIKNSRLRTIDSPEGHDAFLLQFEQVNKHIVEFLTETIPEVMHGPTLDDAIASSAGGPTDKITKESTFGEAEVEDITAW